MTKTYLEKPADVKRKWFLVDAEGKTLGRLAANWPHVARQTQTHLYAACRYRGSCRDCECGEDPLTGNKMESKTYSRHSGYPGGLKIFTAEHIQPAPDRTLDESH